jgi:ubiquitin carboxyl-terminal hydrolase 14
MQSSVTITVKWKKEVYENVSVDLSAAVSELKVQLFSLTGVPPDKQKLILSGKNLKDDQSLESCGAKLGCVVQMMGNAMENWVKPDVKFTFVEDLSAAQQAAVLAKVPAGLSNLGNTCYMAATMQSLRSVPELTTALKEYHDAKPNLTSQFEAMLSGCRRMPDFQSIEDEPQKVTEILFRLCPPATAWGQHDPNQVVTAAAGALYKQLDSSGEPIEPYAFHSALQRAFPQFGERDQGRLMQQDADECFNSFLSAVGTQLPGGLVDNLFGIRQEIILTNAETEAEPPVTQYEHTLNLMCHIEEKDPCSSLTVGLINSTRGSVQKHSSLIGRDCVYNRSLRLANLPPFLAIKFVRFQYDSVAQKKKKILRQVSYPSNLDVTPIVTERLRSIIEQKRRKISEQEDRKKEALLSVSAGGAAAEAPLANEPDEADSLSSPTGMYELVGLVCHKVSTNQLAASFLCLHAYDLGAHGRLRALHWIRKDCGRPLDTVR